MEKERGRGEAETFCPIISLASGIKSWTARPTSQLPSPHQETDTLGWPNALCRAVGQQHSQRQKHHLEARA